MSDNQLYLIVVSVVLVTIGHIWTHDDHELTAQEMWELLCSADEKHMEELYAYCQRTQLKDAVDGVMQMCFIETRNKRAPTTRLDAKYYQFCMCDKKIWTEVSQCIFPKIQKLEVSYNAMQNLVNWSRCIYSTLESMEDEIEHQDDKPGPKKRIGRNKNDRPVKSKQGPKSLKLRPGPHSRVRKM